MILLIASNLPLQIRGPLPREPGLTRGRELRKTGWRQTPSPNEKKE
jgi:hypothetical protein